MFTWWVLSSVYLIKKIFMFSSFSSLCLISPVKPISSHLFLSGYNANMYVYTYIHTTDPCIYVSYERQSICTCIYYMYAYAYAYVNMCGLYRCTHMQAYILKCTSLVMIMSRTQCERFLLSFIIVQFQSNTVPVALRGHRLNAMSPAGVLFHTIDIKQSSGHIS